MILARANQPARDRRAQRSAMAARRKQRQLEEKGEYTDSGMSTPSTSGRFGLKLIVDYSDLSFGETTRTRMSNESGDDAAEDSVQTRSTQAELGLADLPRRGTSRSTVRPSAVGRDPSTKGSRCCVCGTARMFARDVHPHTDWGVFGSLRGPLHRLRCARRCRHVCT